MTSCPHTERKDGVCPACGDCLHAVILNGACYYCGETDLAPRVEPPASDRDIVPADRLKRPKQN